MYSKINAKELLELNNPIIIDIRENDEFQTGHITGSINIPIDRLISDPGQYLDKKKKYYLYCQSGKRSNKICYFLLLDGFNVTDIIDGYDGWLGLRKKK